MHWRLHIEKVPARAASAAAVACVLAGLPPHQRHNLCSNSEELSFIYESKHQERAVDELENEFYEEEFDLVRHIFEQIPPEENEQTYFEEQRMLVPSQTFRCRWGVNTPEFFFSNSKRNQSVSRKMSIERIQQTKQADLGHADRVTDSTEVC